MLAATLVPSAAPAVVPQAPQAAAPRAAVAAVPPPSPQTLSPVVLQQPTPQPANSATLAIILLAIFLGGGAAGSYFLYFNKSGQNPAASPTTSTPELPSAPLAQKITLDIDSSPRGAEVYINGALKGVTPLPFITESSTSPMTIVLQKTGFLQFKQDITPDKSQPFNAKLTEDNGTPTASNTPKNTEPKPNNTTSNTPKTTEPKPPTNATKPPTEPKPPVDPKPPTEPKNTDKPKEPTPDAKQQKKDKIKGIIDARGNQ
jgi:hypothetical protein